MLYAFNIHSRFPQDYPKHPPLITVLHTLGLNGEEIKKIEQIIEEFSNEEMVLFLFYDFSFFFFFFFSFLFINIHFFLMFVRYIFLVISYVFKKKNFDV